jgi:hypothetical protein
MFELLDDAHRATQQKAILKPKYAVWAVFSILLVGAEAGVLIGKHDWDLAKWLQVAVNGLIFGIVFMPLFREIYKFLRGQHTD